MELKTLKQIIKNGGATLNKTGKPANFNFGYQVSKKDCYILNINNTNEILNAINKTLNEINQNEFCGIWIENNLAYIDISTKFIKLENAKIFGNEHNQISIFDWTTKNCIYLK